MSKFSCTSLQPYLVLIVALCLTSCMRKEIPAAPHVAGDVTTATVDMNEDYKWQIFYSLKNNEIVSKNLRTDWDLGFECGASGYHIITNTARFMFAYNTGKTDFSAFALADTVGFANGKNIDMPSSSLDSTAIGDWRKRTPVYVVSNNDKQIFKVQCLPAERGYKVRFAKLNGGGGLEQTVVIKKDDNYNFMFLSLTAGNIINVEPPRASWDVVFTNYTHLFYDMNTPYSVTGCLLNRYNTIACMDSSVAFDQIDHILAARYQLSPQINIIGYNWKEYNLSKGIYITFTKMNYIVRTSDGVYYKLRFLDFARNNVKGNPKWEFQAL
ncbi:MAG: hypothetical protein EOP56_04495 [Sphingobacteriales bacterium]|nr:MAG: hypothetical protein EOP56_04495 [Sphingobacteriales bacterium]